MKKLRVIELFSGIGSQTKALKNLGIDHEVVAISEWEVNTLISYNAVHGTGVVLNFLEFFYEMNISHILYGRVRSNTRRYILDKFIW